MTEKKAVLFDLDGTLIDSLPDISHFMNSVLAAHGLPVHPVKAYCYFTGDGAINLTKRAVGEAHQDMVEAVFNDYRAMYAEHCNDTSHVYDGVAQLISDLKRAGLRLAVLSNKDDADVASVIAHYFGENVFEITRGRQPGVPIKPDPAPALNIAAEMGLTPDDFWYLGDTPTDIRTCRGAGMHLVAAGWGFRPENELREAGAERIALTPQDAARIMLEE